MRAALYARYSSDLQNPRSIADQLRICRAHAARIGADVVAEYSDAAISGTSTVNRPGLLGLVTDARAGHFDVVVVEDLDRLARSGGDSWDIYDDLRAVGVRINSIPDGMVGSMHIGIRGTFNQMFVEVLSAKVRRSQEGAVREGRLMAGGSYGYRRVRRLDDAGELVRGLQEIDEAEAAVVRRIFRDYAAGASPEQIARGLNAEGVAGPGGKLWSPTTIRGSRKWASGILNNELYVGVLVWGVKASSKDRRTGRHLSRARPPADWVRVPHPELRILSDEAWTAAQARQEALAALGRPERARRPKRLLSGLVRCGTCGGVMTVNSSSEARGKVQRYVCRSAGLHGPGACALSRAAKADDVEARVVEAIRTQFLHPEAVQAAVEAFRQARAAGAGEAARARASAERELAETRRRLERLVDQVEQGMPWAAVADRHATLDGRRKVLEHELQAGSADVVTLHPNAAAHYRQLVEDMQAALDAPATAERAEARDAVRAVISAVRILPTAARGAYDIELDADLGPVLAAAGAPSWTNGSLKVSGFCEP